WSSFLSIICLSSPMFGFNDRQLHRIQDSLQTSLFAYFKWLMLLVIALYSFPLSILQLIEINGCVLYFF
ncbi:MAG: hypothetical protein KZQ81_15660, partial [Candidatus Thiodiazotropha sp. (ex Rostrolucina anterorostrata)]|nr:hypothetical protein [Candidatus Thiodiazotropha sp. (ex Rostrolucina anterorostrata)]